MANILSIETATDVCSVALHVDGRLLGHQELFVEKSHSGLLTVLISELTSHCGLLVKEVDAIAISEGPGSYTGLRIGTSTAKGLCYSLEIPMISVSTLEGMLRSVLPFSNKSSLLCPMIDARRMEVYCLLANANGKVIKPTHAKIINEESFIEILEQQEILFFGNGALKCQQVITHSNATFIDDITPNAKNIGAIASDKYLNKEFVDVAYFEPFYLKDFRPTQPKTML